MPCYSRVDKTFMLQIRDEVKVQVFQSNVLSYTRKKNFIPSSYVHLKICGTGKALNWDLFSCFFPQHLNLLSYYNVSYIYAVPSRIV